MVLGEKTDEVDLIHHASRTYTGVLYVSMKRKGASGIERRRAETMRGKRHRKIIVLSFGLL